MGSLPKRQSSRPRAGHLLSHTGTAVSRQARLRWAPLCSFQQHRVAATITLRRASLPSGARFSSFLVHMPLLRVLVPALVLSVRQGGQALNKSPQWAPG